MRYLILLYSITVCVNASFGQDIIAVSDLNILTSMKEKGLSSDAVKFIIVGKRTFLGVYDSPKKRLIIYIQESLDQNGPVLMPHINGFLKGEKKQIVKFFPLSTKVEDLNVVRVVSLGYEYEVNGLDRLSVEIGENDSEPSVINVDLGR